MRKCTRCGAEKPESEFHSAGNGYLRGECKPCKVILEKEARHKRAKAYQEWKSTLSCERCGFDDSRALQFHHPNSDKENCVSTLSRNHSLASVIKEAEKCIVLCANCHQIEHYRL